jgi:hypothetical protein
MYEELETIARLKFSKEMEAISKLTRANVQEAQGKYAALTGQSGVRSGQHEASIARIWIEGSEQLAKSLFDIWVDLIKQRNGHISHRDIGFIAGKIEGFTKTQSGHLNKILSQCQSAIIPTLTEEAGRRMYAVSGSARRDLEIMAREHEAFSKRAVVADSAPAPPTPMPNLSSPSETSSPPPEKPDKGLFVGIIGSALPFVLAILLANGVDVKWQASIAIYMVLACICAWSFWKHAVPHKGGLTRYGGAFLFFAVILAIGAYGTSKQYRREHPLVDAKSHPPAPTVQEGTPGVVVSPSEGHSQPAPRGPRQTSSKEPQAELKPPALVPVFFDKDNLSFRLGNLGDTAATEPKFTIGIANLTKQYLASYDGKEPKPEPLPIPTKKVDDFVRPHESIEKFVVINDLSKPYVKTGDRLFGQFWITCQNCDKWRYYLLYWQVGKGGWYTEIPVGQAAGAFVTSPSLSDQEIDKDIDDLVPRQTRTAIFPDYETMLKATRP